MLLFLLVLFFLWEIRIPIPDVPEAIKVANYERVEIAPNHFQVDNCWLKKNKYGLWEMYLEGADYERGIIYGVLAKELIEKQENHFVARINEMVPNQFYQFFLKLFVAWFNKDLGRYIPEEYQREIYGVSKSFSDKYDYIAPKYYRILNYHAAHDIGHALKDLNMVACTSFSVNKEHSADSSLLIARNFDFYMGDDFAEDKLITFMNPDSGYQYISYSWAGLMGAVSGMNEKGISVTINAAKSDIPFGAKDPISILVREILQYASTIEEAYEIAAKRDVFVSESLLIGSAYDDKAVIIEKSPTKIDMYEPDENYLVCANHYQSDLFSNDSVNLLNIENSDSKPRYDRMMELLHENFPVNTISAAEILRDQKGLGGKDIGMGNSKALNQLIAHHGVIFKPKELKAWVSSSPYQVGDIVCYDLNKIFNSTQSGNISIVDSLCISADRFIFTEAYRAYESFKTMKQKLQEYIMLDIPMTFTEVEIEIFISNNPNSYVTYMVLGQYYQKLGDFEKAKPYFEISLTKEVASIDERTLIKSAIEQCKTNLK
jgi:isopenicillin-N N-acyltransferase like protein